MKLQVVSGKMMPWMAFAWLLRLSFVVTMLVWIDKMKKSTCECSGTWKREYVFWSLIVDVVVRAGMYAFFESVPTWAKALIGLYDLVQLSILWSYATDLEKASCACSGGWMRDTAQAWPILRVGMIVGALQFAFLFSFMLSEAMGDKKNSKRSSSGRKNP
nr:hypothetical protein TetV2_00480 [Oceanusvirus sp.]